MIRAIRDIGNMLIREGKSLIDLLVKTEDNYKYIILLKVSLEDLSLDPDLMEVGEDKSKLKEFKWIGNPDRNKPKDRITTSNIGYLLTETIPHLINGLNEGVLKNKLIEFKKIVVKNII